MAILDKVLSIRDLQRLAHRRLPHTLSEVLESGVEDEVGLARNESAFGRFMFLPRYLVDVREIRQDVTLFDKRYASPFGIGPTGIAWIFRRGAELMLAAEAEEAKIPFVLGGANPTPMESIAEVAPNSAWYQLYAPSDLNISTDLIRRARDAGISTLMVTVDNPIYPNRERDARTGFSLPIQFTPRMILDGLRHPAWTAEWVRNGGIQMNEAWKRYAPSGSSATEVLQFVFGRINNAELTWRVLEEFRRLWPRKLVVKGIQHPSDGVRAAELGADGVLISNHGGKTLDRTPAPVEILPFMKAAVGDRLKVMVDGGVRRGSDIVAAYCLGADFVFFGRPTLYGAIAAKRPGVKRAIDILRKEVETTLGLIGCTSIDQLGPDLIFDQTARPASPPLQTGVPASEMLHNVLTSGRVSDG